LGTSVVVGSADGKRRETRGSRAAAVRVGVDGGTIVGKKRRRSIEAGETVAAAAAAAVLVVIGRYLPCRLRAAIGEGGSQGEEGGDEEGVEVVLILGV